jgi:putative membrane protein
MITEIFVRYLHFISIFTLFAALVAEHLLLSKSMTRSQLQRVATLDAVYGVAALLALVTGLMLWFVVGKPAEFYTQNAVFHTKVLLFVIAALISIYPTIFYVRNRKGNPDDTVVIPKPLIMMVRMELLIFTIMPLLGTLVSRSVGYFG